MKPPTPESHDANRAVGLPNRHSGADHSARTTAPSPPRRWLGRIYATAASGLEWTFGLVSLLVALAIVATVPILQLLSLGYLLECGARVARTGRLRHGFHGIRLAARLGGAGLCTWLLLKPIQLIDSLRTSAQLLEVDAWALTRWNVAFRVVLVLVLVQIVSAWCRGGRIRYFLWPAPRKIWRGLRQPHAYSKLRDRLWDFLVRLQPQYYLWLGLRGFLAALIWLILPISLLVLASRVGKGVGLGLGLLGGCTLATVLIYLPFLQLQLAVDNRWQSAFAVSQIRQKFRRAPVAFWLALLVTLSLAVPLYALKAELIPREAVWLPSLVFVLSILPARLLCGWALARADRREVPRHWLFRQLSRGAAIPVVLLYVGIVYITQYTSWYGAWSLYEQHAFLLPVPFWGL